MAGTDVAGLIGRILGQRSRQEKGAGLKPPLLEKISSSANRQDASVLQLEMAKEILGEVFGASSSEVEEMIMQRMASS